MSRAIFSILLGLASVSQSLADVAILVPDARVFEWNFGGLSAPAIGGPMCVAKPRPLPCGTECWRAIPTENVVGSEEEKDFFRLAVEFKEDIALLQVAEASDSHESTKRTAGILFQTMEMVEAGDANPKLHLTSPGLLRLPSTGIPKMR